MDNLTNNKVVYEVEKYKLRLIMKNKKWNFFWVLSFVFTFSGYGCFSQMSENNTDSLIVNVYSEITDNFCTYIFEPLTEYDEFKTNQRVERIKGLTGDDIIVSYEESAIKISLNPVKTKGDNLNRLLLSVVRLHGYEGYTIYQ